MSAVRCGKIVRLRETPGFSLRCEKAEGHSGPHRARQARKVYVWGPVNG